LSASALGSILAAPRLGRVADRVGAWTVVVGCLLATALLPIPQAFVVSAWQLVALRFLMGLSLAGLLPAINALLRHSVPDASVGTVLGHATSAQVAGPLVGGFVGGHLGTRAVFLATSALLLVGAGCNWMARGRRSRRCR
jgi:MFS family permease